MKKFILIGLCVFLALTAKTQSTTATNTQNSLQSNFLGYTNNYPLLTKTAATNRMKLNGNINYALNGYNASRNGNLLIGISNNFITSGQNIYTGSMGAFSLLHINGPGSGIQEFGYRPWMKSIRPTNYILSNFKKLLTFAFKNKSDEFTGKNV